MQAKKILFCLTILLVSSNIFAQGNEILGVWLTQDNDSKVKISKTTNGKYYGEIIWLLNPKDDNGNIRKDTKNPDNDLKSRNIEGLKILNDFEYNAGDKEWQDGTIYDPKSGSTYKCYMWFKTDSDKLYVKGYIGFSLIGKTVNWKRVK
ncbi:DUF2147 domain-containing protein [Saccharicrinis aurantiacus]|uniref:DUF2147 domain-containing protein n=1 Tax=Saccharicrinis aurantiacus TaxID=1849719 RepID=UPI0024918277|nr:DUF2147 domain-containing protein [Saccharicrinis aurantiacus]